MSEYSRKSLSPLVKSKKSRLLLNDIDKSLGDEDNILDQSSETKEVASQLSLIRKKHDKTKESNDRKRLYCEKLKKELEKASSAASLTEMDSKTLQQKIEQMQNILETNRQKHEEEVLCKKSYLYMLDRMKKEKIAMELKANSLQSSLKSTKHVLDSETDKFRKVRESQYHSRVMLQEIKESLAFDQKRQNSRLLQLEKNIKQRQEFALRRDERQKRQLEISEAAANEDKDSEELKLRESLLVNRLWYIILSKKHEAEIKKASEIEKAFQKIRIATGLSEIDDVVERFLTREQNYSTLLIAVNESENKLEKLKLQNAEAREQLKDHEFEEGSTARKIYAEIDEMEQKLCECYKEYAEAKEKMQRNISTYDNILNWCEKIFHNLEIKNTLDVSSGIRISESKNSLEEMLELIYNKLDEIMTPLENSKDETQAAINTFAKKKTQEIVDEIANIKTNKRKTERSLNEPETIDEDSELNNPRE